MKKVTALLLVAIMAGSISMAIGAEKVRVSGSTTVMPLVQFCAEAFNEEQDEYEVLVTAGGTGVGITDIAKGNSEIAMASREIKAEEKSKYETSDKKFTETLVGYDGIVIAVSPQVFDSGVEKITSDQLRKIYSGEITNWSQLGGKSIEIYALGRKSGSGTRDTFNEEIMGSKEAETPGVATEAEGNSEVKTAIVGSDRAIGYVGYSFVRDKSIMPLALDDVEPTVDNIKSGDYPLARKLYLDTLGQPSAGAAAFIEYVIGADGQDIAQSEGFIPI